MWQSIGGQELGSIWGQGTYVAPDWSAGWLHKEAMFILNTWAQQEKGMNYNTLKTGWSLEDDTDISQENYPSARSQEVAGKIR